MATVVASTRKNAIALADKEVSRTRTALEKQQAKKVELETTSKPIYQRDTGRDSIMTCVKLSLCMLSEFVLREYFGGHAIE